MCGVNILAEHVRHRGATEEYPHLNGIDKFQIALAVRMRLFWFYI